MTDSPVSSVVGPHQGVASTAAPSVVAAMVVHQPGEWTETSLAALAASDYPNLQVLVLVTGTPDGPHAAEVNAAVARHAPRAVVRYLGSNPGFPAACNSVLGLVEGDSGFFLFVHDDVAVAPDAVTRLVEEAFRTNAGILGPKIVDWANPQRLQSVVIGVDRFGERDSVVEEGELDQEQHDAVTDSFMIPTACMLVRADLFRSLRGFEPTFAVSGADLDLCWRAHTTGARVVVAPSAVVRHRQHGESRMNEDVRKAVIRSAESARVHTAIVATQTPYLPLLLVQMFVVSTSQLAIGAVTGNLTQAWAAFRAFVALPTHIGRLRERRQRLAKLRVIPDTEIRALQVRGSARVSSFLRHRAKEAGRSEALSSSQVGEPMVRERSTTVLWLGLILATIVGGRSLIAHGSVNVGQFAPLTGGPRTLMSLYSSGWWVAGFGKAAAAPTGVALAAVASLAALGRTGLVHTLAIIGLPFLGYLGMWQFASVFATRRARVAATLAYAAVPLPYAALSIGRWGVLVAYAALPWCAHLSTKLVGHRAVTYSDSKDSFDYFVDDDRRSILRRCAWLGLVVGGACAFEPALLVVLVELSIVWAAVTWLHGAKLHIAARWLIVPQVGSAVAFFLHLPWIPSFVHRQWWSAIVGAPIEGGRNLGLLKLASFDIGKLQVPVFAAFLFVPALAALLLVRGNRAPWALRGSLLAVAALFVALLDDRAMLPVHLAEPGVMLVPAAFGIAVAIGSLGASLTVDVRAARFGWRQPLGVIATAAMLIGALPAAWSTIGGDWRQPTSTISDLLQQLPSASEDGNYRTMFLGDARVLPATPVHIGWGISYSIIDNTTVSITDQWMPPSSRATRAAEDSIRGIARGSTARAGRLMAPLAVRFIVVPVIDGAASTRDEQIAPPRNLVSALDDQLDLRRRYSSPDLVIYENAAWIPVRSQMTAVGAEASQQAGATAMIGSDIFGAQPLFPNPRADKGGRSIVDAGVVHLAVPFTTNWTLTVDGVPIAPRTAFGITTAFDVSTKGTAVLSYETSTLRIAMVAAQFLLWLAVLAVAVARKRIVLRDAPTEPGAAVMAFQESSQ